MPSVNPRKRKFNPMGAQLGRMMKRPRYKAPVRRVRTAERKVRHYGIQPFVIGTPQVRMFNPFYFIPNGSEFNERIGNKIQNVTLHYRFYVGALCETLAGAQVCQSTTFRVIVFRHPKEWHTVNQGIMEDNAAGVGTTIGTNEILYDTGDDRFAQSFINLNEVNLLHEKRVTVHRDPGTPRGRGTIMEGRVTFPSLRYSNLTDYLKEDNVYVAIVASSSTADAVMDIFGEVRPNFLVSWEDA